MSGLGVIFCTARLQAANKMGDLNCAAYSGGHLATKSSRGRGPAR